MQRLILARPSHGAIRPLLAAGRVADSPLQRVWRGLNSPKAVRVLLAEVAGPSDGSFFVVGPQLLPPEGVGKQARPIKTVHRPKTVHRFSLYQQWVQLFLGHQCQHVQAP